MDKACKKKYADRYPENFELIVETEPCEMSLELFGQGVTDLVHDDSHDDTDDDDDDDDRASNCVMGARNREERRELNTAKF